MKFSLQISTGKGETNLTIIYNNIITALRAGTYTSQLMLVTVYKIGNKIYFLYIWKTATLIKKIIPCTTITNAPDVMPN